MKLKDFFRLPRNRNICVFELLRKGKIIEEEARARVFGTFIDNVEKQKKEEKINEKKY